jgi:hypothetical protein
MKKEWGNQKEKATRRLTLMVIFNGVFFVLVFWCELCFVLLVNGDGESSGVGLMWVMFDNEWFLILFHISSKKIVFWWRWWKCQVRSFCKEDVGSSCKEEVVQIIRKEEQWFNKILSILFGFWIAIGGVEIGLCILETLSCSSFWSLVLIGIVWEECPWFVL